MSRTATAALTAALLLAGSFSAAPSQALSLSFECITDNDATDCGIATSQLSVTLDALGASQARLAITNEGPEDAVYSRLLLDGTILSAVDSITNTPPDVVFSEVSPGVLPGGNGNPILFTAELEVAADDPKPQLGIGPGETLVVDFDIASGFDFQDVLDALADGSLRIGMHVQAFESGGSESVLNVPVPEPGAALLVSAGLVALVRAGRRRG